ncbi:uncharacterized protein LOC113495950 isoform X2 [Trichoplusia ni]|uniref:Uncharacterized protein LOC113495950 isoform X2 n=1 Tax=Trichoplusia ni TaxID=7111 RepID=A0A7E5VR52_TRINI|nr:uncharacterized protein LOC113495950 isoform X2 [Trichoplusia ni]
MHTLNVLCLAAAVACAVPRPLGPSAAPALSQLPHRMGRQPRPFLRDYLMPRLLMPSPIFGYEDSPRVMAPAEPINHDWLNKEIDRINRMDEDEVVIPLEEEFTRWMAQDSYVARPYGLEMSNDKPIQYTPDSVGPTPEEVQPLPPPRELVQPETIPEPKVLPSREQELPTPEPTKVITEKEKKKTFALTPLDKEYYEPADNIITQRSDGQHEGGESKAVVLQPQRQIRQNPNLGRTKNLVAENLDRLRAGLTHDPESTDKPRHIHVLESAADPADSIYGIALIAAVGTALAMAIIGFAFGWYTLSKKAKAAADVDYPAYGVTGPTIDSSGDRKLAHSAHMYHYQHQKQQIIAMERNGLEHRNGSVSDPESEEENEEGDYTVYECPGFATTGDMEVKNPLFTEQPTPATPGKCELVKPQPKD